jgi:uncharacterized protein (DUF952 family)
VTLVTNHIYKSQEDLVLLALDTEKLETEVRYEQLGTSEPFPYIYGVINLDAIVEVLEFPPNSDGSFKFPTS